MVLQSRPEKSAARFAFVGDGMAGARIVGGGISPARIGGQMRFATALALTRAAKVAQEAVRANYSAVLRAPRSYTLNSVRIETATKDKLSAGIKANTEGNGQVAQAKYLRALEFGGPRRPKRAEIALRALGVIDGGEYVVPARGGPLANNGPAIGGFYRRIIARMSSLRVRFNKRGTKRLKSSERGTFYRDRNLIFERLAGGKRRAVLLVIQSAPTYRPMLNWAETADRASREAMPRLWQEAVNQAVATAR